MILGVKFIYRVVFLIILLAALCLYLCNKSKLSSRTTKTAKPTKLVTIDKDGVPDLSKLIETGEKWNEDVKIRNSHFISHLLTDHKTSPSVFRDKHNGLNESRFVVLLVQVHNRSQYLTELIDSLREVKYINESLVIFSHDVEDPNLNTLVRSIDFCATLQIFYPYSIQLYPHEFPGLDPNDCPENMPEMEYYFPFHIQTHL